MVVRGEGGATWKQNKGQDKENDMKYWIKCLILGKFKKNNYTIKILQEMEEVPESRVEVSSGSEKENSVR